MSPGTPRVPIPRLDAVGQKSDNAKSTPRRRDGPKLTRRIDKKVRSGCITCKIRRVKCDETHPSCKRCTDTGRKCDGYVQQVSNTPSPQADACRERIQLFPSTAEYSSDESRSLARFRWKTAHELSLINDEHFWHVVTPKAAQYEPAIYHSIIALGALHELFNDGKLDILRQNASTCSREAFALSHYNKAIQHVIKPAPSQPIAPDVCLMACLLFANIEALRGHVGSAISHVQSGVKILEQFGSLDQQRNMIDQHASIESLTMLLNRLDFATVSMTGQNPMKIMSDPCDSSSDASEVPTAFTSIEDASQSLHFHLNELFHGQVTIENACKAGRDIFPTARDHYVNIFKHWGDTFDSLIGEKTFSEDQIKAAKTLQLIQAYFHPAVHCTSEPVPVIEPTFDDHLPVCRRVLKLAQDVINLDARNEGAVRQPVMTFGCQIVGPLYGLAQNCHDPVIRREAAQLLQVANRREGIWDSTVAAIVANKIIEIEERGLGDVRCAADVPRWARIEVVDIVFDDEGRVSGVRYTKGAKAANGEIIRNQFLERLD